MEKTEKSKKVLNIVIIVAIIAVVGMALYFFFNTKDYWKNQMDIQNEELILRTPQSVDSLISEIEWRDSMIDAWSVVMENHQNVIDSISKLYSNQITTLKNDNRVLQNVIDHQNQMIANLQKK